MNGKLFRCSVCVRLIRSGFSLSLNSMLEDTPDLLSNILPRSELFLNSGGIQKYFFKYQIGKNETKYKLKQIRYAYCLISYLSTQWNPHLLKNQRNKTAFVKIKLFVIKWMKLHRTKLRTNSFALDSKKIYSSSNFAL